jgi:hypothetical protein
MGGTLTTEEREEAMFKISEAHRSICASLEAGDLADLVVNRTVFGSEGLVDLTDDELLAELKWAESVERKGDE